MDTSLKQILKVEVQQTLGHECELRAGPESEVILKNDLLAQNSGFITFGNNLQTIILQIYLYMMCNSSGDIGYIIQIA